MYCFVLIGFYFVALVGAWVKVSTNYHMDIGIPEANRIKKVEDEMLTDQNRNVSSRRIVGGFIAPPHAYPFLAGLLATFFDNPSTSVCGSSLISANRLVTAAHCWRSAGSPYVREFIVILGSQFLYKGGLRIPTSMVVVHPNYIPQYYTNDIAIISLPYPVTFSNVIQPITLPKYSLHDSFEGEIVTAAGYGLTSDAQKIVPPTSILSHINLRVMSLPDCTAVFYKNFVQPSNICTDGRDGTGICNGDSGGPLIVNRNGENVLVGISSFGSIAGCQIGYPSVFTRVTSFYNYILQNM